MTYPPRAFDQDLQRFVRLAKEEDWHFSGVDLDQLNLDALEQCTQREHFAAAEARFKTVRKQFALAQAARYRRFAAALNAARSVFQCDATLASKLAEFKRPNSRC